ncbi:MAG: bifunctional N-acetylglucosamine-1-phosphate uridyltransferase/glucosamine-1-phosphate acetyltransferase [Rhodospirillaceae bacterium]|nr:bifunctional N-acetylglucosamine-1-phosphate uridyltransferase/glucosamine-1-phosphate acetyltransferase [Rhodospirillaceae bacterium]
MSETIAAIVLAAGKGTRMNSKMPKVLHKLAGLPLICHVIGSVEELEPQVLTVVISPEQEEIEPMVGSAHIAYQHHPLGTGDAVRSALKSLNGFAGTVLVAFGADPLITTNSLRQMILAREVDNPPDVVVMGFKTNNPGRYGRLVQNSEGRLERIVEFSDVATIDRHVELYNGGVMAINGKKLAGFIEALRAENTKKEFYLTDIIDISNKRGGYSTVVEVNEIEALGIDTREDLAVAENIMQNRLRKKIMESGVTLIAPETIFFSHDTVIGPDSVIHPHVIFGCGAIVKENVEIKSFSHIEGAEIGEGAAIGPFARLRPGAKIDSKAGIGNFVEIKKANIGAGAKINHLAYVGDADVGRDANIGAGTITCNFDGFSKHTTTIGANAFVGSNSALVAPVQIGNNSIIGAGSTVTRSVPSDALVVARAKVREVTGGASRFRSRRLDEKKND